MLYKTSAKVFERKKYKHGVVVKMKINSKKNEKYGDTATRNYDQTNVSNSKTNEKYATSGSTAYLKIDRKDYQSAGTYNHGGNVNERIKLISQKGYRSNTQNNSSVNSNRNNKDKSKPIKNYSLSKEPKSLNVTTCK